LNDILKGNGEVISLGGGCDVATEFLGPSQINETHHFFDFLWNLDGGLKNVCSIIDSDFKGFEDLQNYIYDLHPEWNTNLDQGPKVLACANLQAAQLVHARYKNIAFVHHKRTQQMVDSMTRKKDRLLAVFQSVLPVTFIYYRQYHAPINGTYVNGPDYDILDKLNHFKWETDLFMSTFDQKYPKKEFRLISLFMEPSEYMQGITDKIDTFFQELDNSDRLTFERVFRRRGSKTRAKWKTLLKLL